MPTKRSSSAAACPRTANPTSSGEIRPARWTCWIEVGLPDEKDVRKACGRAREVAVLAYGARRVETWWSDNAAAFARLSNLRVLTLTGEETAALQTLAARTMSLTCTVQEQHVWLASASSTIELAPVCRTRS